MRQLKGESRTAAEVVMDDALVQDDGIDPKLGNPLRIEKNRNGQLKNPNQIMLDN